VAPGHNQKNLTQSRRDRGGADWLLCTARVYYLVFLARIILTQRVS
jgi:hypothetical protein